jgi:sugar O-acyltransferase (sialic acid O-acetyltransferase NeuD family)
VAKPIVIYGASTLGEMAKEILLESSREFAGFIEDFTSRSNERSAESLGTWNELSHILNEVEFLVGIGDNLNREKIQCKVESEGGVLAKVIHPKAYVSTSAEIGNGNIIFPNSYIGSGTKLGNGNIIFPGASLTHHSVIGNFNFFAPNVSIGGFSNIGDFCKLGMNSVIRPYSKVSDHSTTEILEVRIDTIHD